MEKVLVCAGSYGIMAFRVNEDWHCGECLIYSPQCTSGVKTVKSLTEALNYLETEGREIVVQDDTFLSGAYLPYRVAGRSGSSTYAGWGLEKIVGWPQTAEEANWIQRSFELARTSMNYPRYGQRVIGNIV